MGNMLKAMSMMLISVVGIGVVALAISMEPPRDSIDCEEQICTTGTIAQVVDGDTVTVSYTHLTLPTTPYV